MVGWVGAVVLLLLEKLSEFSHHTASPAAAVNKKSRLRANKHEVLVTRRRAAHTAGRIPAEGEW